MEATLWVSSSTQPYRLPLPAACMWLQRSSWLRCRLSLPRSTRVRGSLGAAVQLLHYSPTWRTGLVWGWQQALRTKQFTLIQQDTGAAQTATALTLRQRFSQVCMPFQERETRALTHSLLFHLANSSQSTVLCLEWDSVPPTPASS